MPHIIILIKYDSPTAYKLLFIINEILPQYKA